MGKKEGGLGRKGGGNWFFSPSPLPEIFPNCVCRKWWEQQKGKRKMRPKISDHLKRRRRRAGEVGRKRDRPTYRDGKKGRTVRQQGSRMKEGVNGQCSLEGRDGHSSTSPVSHSSPPPFLPSPPKPKRRQLSLPLLPPLSPFLSCGAALVDRGRPPLVQVARVEWEKGILHGLFPSSSL